MNFFESQERVRRNTFQLVFLFAVAVVALIIMTNLLVMAVLGYFDSRQLQSVGSYGRHLNWEMFAVVSAGVGAVVLGGSLYKIMALSGGGRTVAESLGGKLIPRNTDDLAERKLLNVVEEMAIASGTPAPPVYLLEEESGINAFAAGFSPRDAVIGVTRGTIDHLSRDQLQGVIAHEFSHIFNGDMRLNIRLIGVLNGILVIGLIGYFILRSTAFSRRGRSNSKGAGGILLLGGGLMVLGFAGTFFGNLIKAAVSRQREYLADSSAVQFTRNPDGIAGALKRIGGLSSGSQIENPGAPEISHALFAQGVSGFLQSLAATHPPLADRIRRIDPHWDGKFDSSSETDRFQAAQEAGPTEAEKRMEQVRRAATVLVGATAADVANGIHRIGNPGEEDIRYAGALMAELPAVLDEAAREPFGARALVYCLVLDREAGNRAEQLAHLREQSATGVFAVVQKLAPVMARLDVRFRLPLVDLVIPTLKQLSATQYRKFQQNLTVLIEQDSRVDLLEWSLQKILFHHLDAHFSKPARVTSRVAHPGQIRKDCELLLSVMARAGGKNEAEAEGAFATAKKVLEVENLQLLPVDRIRLPDLDRALRQLARLKPLAKSSLLKACAASVLHDGKVAPLEVELLRAFADVIDCPIPPLPA
ncbi:MAG: M48 family metallopeptidase [Gammaproteobacteria bacterium]|nr:M48 family metallopeptidase [Gammaproteobacteria bacterium]